MTTTSAGNGTSAGDSGGGSGEWSWFAPVRKSPTPHDGESAQDEERDGGGMPSRSVTPIRPVGSGAERRASGPDDLPDAAPASPRQAQSGGERPRSAAPYGGPAAGGPRDAGPVTGPGTGAGGTQGLYGREHVPSFEEFRRLDTPAGHPGPRPGEEIPGGYGAAAPTAAVSSGPTSDGMLIRRTMEEIEPVADAVTAYFYAMLFVQHPQLRELFPASMDSQRDRLFRAFLTAARLLDDPDLLTEYLSHLGRGHRKYGTLPEHYPAVGECLLGALAQYARDTWSDEVEAAWVRAYTTISQTMIDAAAEDEKHSPAWWNAEIVAHEMRTRDIAVITVRPDQPYPFLAGQYTSLETPWWPRVWRNYSFASAPRSDGLLSFHVKCVPAGWVSSALVNRARQGDVVRLGPPAGSMTVDHASESGLLCLGGGTGIAPIKAMVEDVAEHGRSRPVEVFYGARNDHDLYDLQTMRRLEQRHRWLSVRPVVSDGASSLLGPSGAGAVGGKVLAGELPDVVQQYGPWAAYVGYLSGPPGMIRSGVDALKGAGIPAHRIRHDSLEELVAAAE